MVAAIMLRLQEVLVAVAVRKFLEALLEPLELQAETRAVTVVSTLPRQSLLITVEQAVVAEPELLAVMHHSE